MKPPKLDGLQPGSDEWYRKRKAIDPMIAKHHKLRRYEQTEPFSTQEDAVVALFPTYHSPGTIRRVVRQSGGIIMPKYPLPAREPIPPQLNPDVDVNTDPRWTYHRHDRERSKPFVMPRHDIDAELKSRGVRRPRKVPVEIDVRFASLHIDRDKSKEHYDPKTGLGDHHGENVKGFHWHAPGFAKYTNFGDNKRIDVGPGGLDAIRDAYRADDLPAVLFMLEGKMKHLSAESNGWHVVSIASVTLWDKDEVRELAEWARDNIPGVPFYIGPDADWGHFDRNHGAVFRQAIYVQTILRENGVPAAILAPAYNLIPGADHECTCKPGVTADLLVCLECGGYHKAVDDHYAAGGTTETLIVLDRREPRERIAEFVQGLPIDRRRKERTERALSGLSLHDRDDLSLRAPLKTVQRVTHARRPQDVPEILRDLGPALEIAGSLEIEKDRWWNEKRQRWLTVWNWVGRPPTIRVCEPFRASEGIVSLGELIGKSNETPWYGRLMVML